MKWLAMSAVFLVAFFGLILESAQESPTPVAVSPATSNPEIPPLERVIASISARSERDDDLLQWWDQFRQERVQRMRENPSESYDQGITPGWSNMRHACLECLGEGEIRPAVNPKRPVRWNRCIDCNGTGRRPESQVGSGSSKVRSSKIVER